MMNRKIYSGYSKFKMGVQTTKTGKKEVASILLDPMKETTDIDVSNNSWPSLAEPTNFSLYKTKQAALGQSQGLNPMQKAKQN